MSNPPTINNLPLNYQEQGKKFQEAISEIISIIGNDDGSLQYRVWGMITGQYLIPQKKREKALPILAEIKELTNQISGWILSDTFYPTDEWIEEYKVVFPLDESNKEVDLKLLEGQYLNPENIKGEEDIKRYTLTKFLFSRYDDDCFDEQILARLCRDIQKHKTCRICNTKVFKLHSEHEFCQSCFFDHHQRFSSFIGNYESDEKGQRTIFRILGI